MRVTQANGKAVPGVSYGVIRPAAFFLLFAMSLSASFMPLHMANLYQQPLFGLPKDIVIGLPISMEIFCTMLVLFPGGSWMDRRGWHEPFLIGAIITITGMFLSGTATESLQFIIYRGIVGIGYGLAWMSLQGFVMANTKPNERARGMSNLVAGIFAGSLCGGAIGAMLSERVGYGPVFFVAAGLMFLPLLFVIIFMKDSFVKPTQTTLTTQEKITSSMVIKFLLNRDVFSILLFSVVSTSICLIGILHFIVPIYLKSIGTSQSNIGRALMIFGLCMIYVAPFISKFVDLHENKRIFIVISGILGGLSLIIFYAIQDQFLAAVLMIFLFGLAYSFGDAAQTIYIIHLKITQKIGLGSAMSIQRIVDKLGQTLGPIVFGLMTGIFGIGEGITMIGLAYLLATFLFLIGARKNKALETPN